MQFVKCSFQLNAEDEAPAPSRRESRDDRVPKPQANKKPRVDSELGSLYPTGKEVWPEPDEVDSDSGTDQSEIQDGNQYEVGSEVADLGEWDEGNNGHTNSSNEHQSYDYCSSQYDNEQSHRDSRSSQYDNEQGSRGSRSSQYDNEQSNSGYRSNRQESGPSNWGSRSSQYDNEQSYRGSRSSQYDNEQGNRGSRSSQYDNEQSNWGDRSGQYEQSNSGYRSNRQEIEQSNSGSRSSRPNSERSGGDMTESTRVDDFFSQFTLSQTSFAPQSESSSVPQSATEPLNLSKTSSATPPELQTSQLTQPTQTTPPTQPIQTKTPTEPASQPVFQTAITDSDEDVSSLWEKKLNPKRVTRSRK